MKNILLLLPALALTCTSFLPSDEVVMANSKSSAPSVLLELFTSQGCSSCPSADKLIGQYAQDKHLIPLSFHVDYWNYIGWKDPFSSKDFSDRQRVYANRLESTVYTPQLVVNGSAVAVGSDKGKIDAILGSVNSTSQAGLELSITATNNKINVKYTGADSSPNESVNAALVLKKAVTKVKRGENSGRDLVNYNIVMEFRIDPKSSNSGTFSFDIPKGHALDELAVVAFVQDKKTLAARSAIQGEIKG